ncbi:MAG: hypothetical protein ABIN39_00305 [candidate division WOR-3 bacterium]
MKKRVKILKQKEEAEFNRSEWHNMTPAQRLKIVEELRENYSKNFFNKNEQGFKRVFKKFQRKKS